MRDLGADHATLAQIAKIVPCAMRRSTSRTFSDRARAMNLSTWAEGKAILAEFAALNSRLQKAVYTAADKKAIVAALGRLGLKKKDESTYVILRQNRGH